MLFAKQIIRTSREFGGERMLSGSRKEGAAIEQRVQK